MVCVLYKACGKESCAYTAYCGSGIVKSGIFATVKCRGKTALGKCVCTVCRAGECEGIVEDSTVNTLVNVEGIVAILCLCIGKLGLDILVCLDRKSTRLNSSHAT